MLAESASNSDIPHANFPVDHEIIVRPPGPFLSSREKPVDSSGVITLTRTNEWHNNIHVYRLSNSHTFISYTMPPYQ